jgi:hypothetical protein
MCYNPKQTILTNLKSFKIKKRSHNYQLLAKIDEASIKAFSYKKKKRKDYTASQQNSALFSHLSEVMTKYTTLTTDSVEEKFTFPFFFFPSQSPTLAQKKKKTSQN